MNLGTRGQHTTPRPPKPLLHQYCTEFKISNSANDFLEVYCSSLHAYKFCQQSGFWFHCCTYTVMHATNGRQYYTEDREWGKTSHTHKNHWMSDWFVIGFQTLWSRCTQAFVPHINLWEPCCFTKVPDGPQTYTVNVLCLQEEGVQIRMSEWSQSFTLTKNVGRGFILCSTLLHNGLPDSPIRWRCHLRVVCIVRRPVTALDCVLLEDRNLALAPRQGPEINPLAPEFSFKF
jgi:hypothetical protein